MSWLDDYYLDAQGLFVIPPERLSEDGLAPEFAALVATRTPLGEKGTALFDEAFRAYWRRTAELSSKTSLHWFPPRAQHVCVVTEPDRIRPYFQPFYKSAWLVYASDFDPALSNVEFAVFQLLQTERMSLLQQLVPALALNLSYWLTREPDEVDLFCQACASATRPDASAYRALADALPWIRQLHHEVLRRPVLETAEPLVTVQGTGLMIPKARERDVDALVKTWSGVLRQVVDGHFAHHATRTRNHAEEICAWLRDSAPRVVITGAKNEVVWDPTAPAELGRVRGHLKGITESAAASLRGDLEVVGARSQAFVDSLRHPGELPAPDPRTADQNGLTYMHLERREVAYNLREERMNRLREPAPPFERAMIGARTVHEWGHLATEAGWIPVPESRKAEHDALSAEAATIFDEIVAGAPGAARSMCAGSLRELARDHGSTGEALVAFGLLRIEDFQSNLLSQRYLAPAERETYIKNNVRTLVHEYSRESLFQRLARYSYEYQYLRFSAVEDPRAFFLRSTWFSEQYLVPGILSTDLFERLFDRMGRICDTYEVDEEQFLA